MKRGYAAAVLLAFCVLLCIVSSVFVQRESNEILQLLADLSEKTENGEEAGEVYEELCEKCEDAGGKLHPFVDGDSIEQLKETVDSMRPYVEAHDEKNLADYAAVCRNLVENWRFSFSDIL